MEPRPHTLTFVHRSTPWLAALALFAATARAGGTGVPCVLGQTPLSSSTSNQGDFYGLATSTDGVTAAIGAYVDDGLVADTGAVHVHVSGGGTWTHQAQVFAADGAAQARFGFDVAVDGDTLLVGAPFDNAAAQQSGSAYVFVRNGSSWTQQAKLVPQDLATFHRFGHSVTLAGDTAVVGKSQPGGAGAAYVFVRSGTTWSQQERLSIGGGVTPNLFGSAVSLSGESLLVSDPSDATGAGAAYVFVRNGTSWSQQAKLVATDADPFDFGGTSAAIAGDLAVLGAPEDDQAGLQAGAAYVFERTGTTWTQRAKLLSSVAAAGDELGTSVAVDGGRVLAGAPYDDSAGVDAGAVFLYTDGGSGWVERAKLVVAGAIASGGAGLDVALRGDTALVGAPTIAPGSPPGSAHAFRLAPCAEPFCPGDGSLGTACPCGNLGSPGRGCENSSGTGGALLTMTGSTSPDTAELSSSGELSNALSIFLQSPNSLAPAVLFGDGVRCVGTPALTLYVAHAVGGVATKPVAGDLPISARSAALGDPIAPGSVRYYQVYYRDPVPGFCPQASSDTFNASSGLVVHW